MEAENPAGTAGALICLAFVASWEGRYEEALRLAGASDPYRQRAGGGPPSDFLASFLGDPVEDARRNLPEDAARRAEEEGRAMSVGEAVALARSQSV